jgi:hypothetical protein
LRPLHGPPASSESAPPLSAIGRPLSKQKVLVRRVGHPSALAIILHDVLQRLLISGDLDFACLVSQPHGGACRAPRVTAARRGLSRRGPLARHTSKSFLMWAPTGRRKSSQGLVWHPLPSRNSSSIRTACPGAPPASHRMPWRPARPAGPRLGVFAQTVDRGSQRALGPRPAPLSAGAPRYGRVSPPKVRARA